MNPSSLGRLNKVIGVDEEDKSPVRSTRTDAASGRGHAVQPSRTERTPTRQRPGAEIRARTPLGSSSAAAEGGTGDEARRDLERICLRAEREGPTGWAKVIPRIRAYLEAYPRDSQAWAYLARARAAQGEESEALRAAQEALKLDPGATLGHAVSTLVARSAAKAQQWDTVAKHAEAALSSQPSDPDALELLVWAHASRSQPQKAEDTLVVLAQAHPERAAAAVKKLARERTTSTQDRHRWLSRACQWAKGGERPLKETAEVCLQLERTSEAMQWYKEYFSQKGGACEPEVTNSLVQLCVRAGRGDEALEVYRRALAATPERFELHRGYGQLLRKQNRTAEAIEAVRQGAGLAPSLQEAAGMHVVLAELQQGAGQTREAFKSWEAATALDDSSVPAWRGLYTTAVMKGNDTEQARALAQLVRLEPHNAEWTSKLSSVQQKQRGGSDDPASLIRAAVAALQECNPGGAMGLLQKVERPSPEVHTWMGYTQLVLGNTEKAIDHFQAAMRHSSASPQTRLYWSLALKDCGDEKAAKQEFASAVRGHPALQRALNDPSAQDALAAKNLERAGLSMDFPGAGQRLAGHIATLAREHAASREQRREREAVDASSPDAWRDALAENQAVEVYSKSAGKWMAGKVKQVMPQMVKIKYLIDGQWCEKVLLRNSDSLRLAQEEHSPDPPPPKEEEAQGPLGSAGSAVMGFFAQAVELPAEGVKGVVQLLAGGGSEQPAEAPPAQSSSSRPKDAKDPSRQVERQRTEAPKRSEHRGKTWTPSATDKGPANFEPKESRRTSEQQPQLYGGPSMMNPPRVQPSIPAVDKGVVEELSPERPGGAWKEKLRAGNVGKSPIRSMDVAKSPTPNPAAERERGAPSPRFEPAEREAAAVGRSPTANPASGGRSPVRRHHTVAMRADDKSPARPDAASSAPLGSFRDKSPRRPTAPASIASGSGGKVLITIVSATDLMAADSNGKSDPYCKCRVRGVPNTEFKTDTIKKELNPVWNFKQPMPDAAPGCTIEFEVFDWDRFTKDDPLGKAKLEMSQEPCSPDESFEVELKLGGTPGAKGSLKVKITGLRPAARGQRDRSTTPRAAVGKSVTEMPGGRDRSPRRPTGEQGVGAEAENRRAADDQGARGGGVTPRTGEKKDVTIVKGIEVETEELLPVEELQIGKKLGTGGFGAVYQGRYRGQEVAIKKLHISDGQVTAAQVDEFKKEVACLQALRHARLVSFIGAALQPPHSLCIVTEFMPNGSLYDLLHQRKQRLERSQRASISVQCVEGVTFLHSRSPPFVHRDLKSLNVVMDFALNAKLCDFGLTQSMEKTHISRRDNEGGSPRYMAPELFDSKGKITEKVDVWATGALVLEVFTGRLPHEECNALQQVMTKTLIERKMPFLDWKDVPQDLKVLAERCFEFQPQRRIDAPSLLEGLRNLRP